MRRIPHRREARPVIRPAIHVLLMAGLEELDFAELAFFVQLLDDREYSRAYTTVSIIMYFMPGLLHQVDDLLAILDAGRHRHGAGHVLARLQRGDGLPGVVGNRRVDVDRIHVRVLQQFFESV